MCFGGTRTTSSTTTSSSLPKNIKQLTDKLAGKAGQLLESEYQPYEGDRVAGFTDQQTNAMSGMEALYGNQPVDRVNDTVNGYLTDFATTPAERLGQRNVSDPGRIVDEDGRLGSISGYMDPYLGQVLNPTLEAIDEAGAQASNRMGHMANMSGAYGDARHGILERSNNEDIMDARARATADLYSGAFNNAMNLRGQDMGRFLETDFYNTDSNRAMDIFNAQMGETEANRLYQGGMGMQSVADSQQSMNMDTIASLFGMGEQGRSLDQGKLDAGYEEYLRQQQDPYDIIAAVTSAVSGLPYDRSQTTTTQEPNNGGWSVLGNVFGGLF